MVRHHSSHSVRAQALAAPSVAGVACAFLRQSCSRRHCTAVCVNAIISTRESRNLLRRSGVLDTAPVMWMHWRHRNLLAGGHCAGFRPHWGGSQAKLQRGSQLSKKNTTLKPLRRRIRASEFLSISSPAQRSEILYE